MLSHGPPSYHKTWAVQNELGIVWPMKLWSWAYTASIIKVAAFCYDWNRHFLRIQTDLPCMQFFLKNCDLWTYRLPSLCHSIPHSIASDQGAYITANEVWPRAHAYRIQCPYHVPHHPGAAALTGWWNCFMKFQLHWQQGGHTLQGCVQALQKAVYALNQGRTDGDFARSRGFKDPGIKKWKWEWQHLLFPLVTHYQKFLLPFPMTLFSASLEVILPKRGILSQGNNIPLNWKYKSKLLWELVLLFPK